MPGPGIVAQPAEIRDHLCPKGIQVNVADQLQEVGLCLHYDGLVAVLEQVAHPLMAAIERPGVSGEEGAHAARERPTPRPDQEMGVVGQEGPGGDGERSGVNQRGDPGHERVAIDVIPENGCPLDPPHHDMVQGVRGVQTGLAWHLEGENTRPEGNERSNVPYCEEA